MSRRNFPFASVVPRKTTRSGAMVAMTVAAVSTTPLSVVTRPLITSGCVWAEANERAEIHPRTGRTRTKTLRYVVRRQPPGSVRRDTHCQDDLPGVGATTALM